MRKRKTEVKLTTTIEEKKKLPPFNGETLQCSVCGKDFVVNDDTRYMANNGYTCSWKCFLKYVHTHKKEIMKGKNKNG